MDDNTLAVVAVALVASGIIAGIIASGKNQSGIGFFMLGLVIGPLAVPIALIMPARPEQ